MLWKDLCTTALTHGDHVVGFHLSPECHRMSRGERVGCPRMVPTFINGLSTSANPS